MPSTTFTLERDDDEFEIEIEYTVAPLIPASRWPWPGDPAEGGEVETLDAYLDGAKFELTDDEAQRIEQWIYDNHDYNED